MGSRFVIEFRRLQVTILAGMPSCSCEVTALFKGKQSSNQFLAAQARLWKGGVFERSILTRVTAQIPQVKLLEDLGRSLESEKDL